MQEKQEMKIARVLVTGSAGTVGNYVVAELLKKGYLVRAADIRETPADELQGLPLDNLEVRTGDLTSRDFASSVATGVDAVIHTAAIIDISKSYKELSPLNVTAVRFLYEAARKSGARVFVHFSSGSIYGPEEMIVSEETPIRPKSAYEQTKAESEDVIRVLGTDGKLPWVVLRPGLIYGPRGRFLANGFTAIPVLMRYLVGAKVPALEGGPKTNLVHAEDVARAAVFLMETPKAWGTEYNVAESTVMSFGEILTDNFAAYGLETAGAVRIPSPSWAKPFKPLLDTDFFFRVANLPVDIAWNAIVKEYGLAANLHPHLDRETAPYMFHHVIFSTERIAKLGFEYVHHDYRAELPGIMRWCIDHRWLPGFDEIPPASGWTPQVGLIFSERMAGHYVRRDAASAGKGDAVADEDRHPFVFEIDASATRIERFVRKPVMKVKGTLFMEGMAQDVPVEGTLEIPLITRRKIIYDLAFSARDGKRYTFTGEKNVRPLAILQTMTTLPGKVLDEQGNEVADAQLRFNVRRDLLPMVRSFALTH